MLIDPIRDPLEERSSWRIWPEPDYARLQRTSALFQGKHDFGAFGRAPISGGHTVRTITRSEWQRNGSQATLTLEADAFLYHMVRRIVAASVEVGAGKGSEGQIEARLADPSRTYEGHLAPAKGLCLEAVFYGD